MRFLSSRSLPSFSYIAGILTAGFLCLLHITGKDEKGLYPTMHFGWLAACLITATALVLLALLCRELDGKFRYRQLFRPSVPAAAGTLAAAAGLGISGIMNLFRMGDYYDVLCGIISIVGAAALVFLAHCRYTGRHPVYLVRGAVTVVMMIRLICSFRRWNSPQLAVYLFPLLASVFLMLACYHRTALDAGSHSRRAYVFTSQAAAILCCGAAISSDWLFYLTAAAWMGLDIPDLRHSKKHTPKD